MGYHRDSSPSSPTPEQYCFVGISSIEGREVLNLGGGDYISGSVGLVAVVKAFGFRVWGSGFRVEGLGFRV